MVSYICIYDIINRKTYLKTLYLIPNTFKEWAENFKSLPQYCPVMDVAFGLYWVLSNFVWVVENGPGKDCDAAVW